MRIEPIAKPGVQFPEDKEVVNLDVVQKIVDGLLLASQEKELERPENKVVEVEVHQGAVWVNLEFAMATSFIYLKQDDYAARSLSMRWGRKIKTISTWHQTGTVF